MSGVLEKMTSSAEKTVCANCKNEITAAEKANSYFICPKCGKYMRIPPRARIEYLVDGGSFTELFGADIHADPINFPDYKGKAEAARKKSGENEGVLCGRATIGGYATCIFVMNPEFMMASMGTVVGDKITALFEYATKHGLPVIGFTASGGARMQEGVLSLMQMVKTSLAVKRHSDKGLFCLECVTDPTMGGVTASFASLGDVIIGEPDSIVGFAGKRVIEQNTKEKLPPDFQTAEFMLNHGFLDGVVERKNQRDYITKMLMLHGCKRV